MALYYPTTKDFVQTTLGAALSAGVTASATLASTASTLGVQNKAGIMIIDRVDANGTATPSKREVVSFAGTSAATVTTLVRGLAGTSDADHAVGAIVEFSPDCLQQQEICDILDGTDVGTFLTPKITTSINDANGNEVIKTPATASAVNEITVTNAAAAGVPSITATGGDDNISIKIAGKGTGGVKIGTGTVAVTDVLDEDDMASDSATKLATQQSIKAYVPVKASGAEVTTGTNDAKFATPKALSDAGVNTRLASKIITGTRDVAAATGDVAYTGVGFTPTAIFAMATIDAAGQVSIGFGDSSKTTGNVERGAAGNWYLVDSNVAGKLLFYEVSAGNFVYATVKTYDADGFTLTWTKTGSPTGTLGLIFLCFK